MRWFSGKESNHSFGWRAEILDIGLSYSRTEGADSLSAAILEPAFVQWEDAGYAISQDERWHIPWRSLYALLLEPDVQADVQSFGIPPLADLAPRLSSRGSLTDRDFVVGVAGWSDLDGRAVSGVTLCGAVATVEGRAGLLPPASWELVEKVALFAQRPDEKRDERSQRIAWGEIRALALAAGARLDDFLYRTVVLSPDRLQVGMRRADGGGPQVVEIVPGFEGCPDSWLAAFDAQSAVRDRYDLPTKDGVVQVVVRPEVRSVLEQVKRFPGRRVAGVRAEAFITNPFAALGETATLVIDADEFESERERAGLTFDRFTAYLQRDAEGALIEVGLLIETGHGPHSSSTHYQLLFEEVRPFVDLVRGSLAAGHQLCSWQEFEFELLGNVAQELETLEQALEEHEPRAAEGRKVTRDDIYDLSMYSERIDAIGEEKPFASPYIARKDDSGEWFPDNIVNIIELLPERPGGQNRYVSLTPEEVEKLERDLRRAREEGRLTVSLPGVNDRIPVADLERVISAFTSARDDAEKGALGDVIREKSKRNRRQGLLIKPNVESVDYHERRREALQSEGVSAQLPEALKPAVELKQHQIAGVAWLQHLFNNSPGECRGAVLADDMGLGKTLQLLVLIASAHERDPELAPALIVAPVALLENWRDEAGKFFRAETLSILQVYGETLAQLRVPKEDIDDQLRRDGLVKFLKTGWRGHAKIVLTTYETLRELEFSFAAEKWSILVCDEAQKIKNPNALITRAAKKQNARFRVACTGTPVENTLTDLWCLFDFIQPGLLGALNEFGRTYRRPIEAKTDDEKARVEELRTLIAPQILRRLKSDVARDLPEKESVSDCKSLQLTSIQRGLYSHAIGQYARRNGSGQVTPFKNALGLLHYLRLVCTDPQPYGMTGFRAEPLATYRAKAPKLDWLLRTLGHIRERGEKALVFCEFKDLQRLIRHYVQEELNYAADIINGDTTAVSENERSRQKRIRAFQDQIGFGVLILSPLAVGFGVNIQAANHVIHYTRTWNPAKEDQATDRAYRIGQTRKVHVYCPVVSADDFKTFDVRLDELLSYKRSLARDMLNGSGDLSANDFDVGDVAPPGSPEIKPTTLSFDDVLSMQPRVFEAYIALLWSCQGYSRVTLTPPTGDGGVDVVATRGSRGQLVQCKSAQQTERQLGWDAIKDVVTGEAAYRLQYPGVEFDKVCVTTQSFNGNAETQARLNRVQLIDRERLAALHGNFPVTLDDVQRVLYSGIRNQ